MDDQKKNQAIDSILATMNDKLEQEREKTQAQLDEIDRIYQEKVAERKAQEAAREHARQTNVKRPSLRERVRDDGWIKSIAVASSAGFTLLASTAACLWLGYQVDNVLGSTPVGMVWGGILGGFGGVYLMYKELSR